VLTLLDGAGRFAHQIRYAVLCQHRLHDDTGDERGLGKYMQCHFDLRPQPRSPMNQRGMQNGLGGNSSMPFATVVVLTAPRIEIHNRFFIGCCLSKEKTAVF